MDTNVLDKVVQDTMRAIENAKEQIFEIAENARQECNRVRLELSEIKQQTLGMIKIVDDLERKEKLARIRLMEVSRNLVKYKEKDIFEAYEHATAVQVQLSTMREREHYLRQKRDELNRSLRNLEETVKRAENLVSTVGVVLGFIESNLKEINLKLDNMQHRQQMGLQIIKAQEEERKRVAREIHDGPAQAMSNIVLRTEVCQKLIDVDPSRLRGELQELKDLVKGTLQDVRKIIFDLRPMTLDDLGLIPTLKRYLADFKDKNNLTVEFKCFGQERRFRPTLEVAIFRLIQESLNNIRKHAEASKVDVKLEVTLQTVVIRIKDNGKGFDVDDILATRNGNSFGLLGMYERVDLINGQIEFFSKPGQGTEVVIKVPVKD